MSIPYWRSKKYTDDGCVLYECLNCYHEWEARTSPKWAKWKFCPYCGCQWEGQKEWDEEAKAKRHPYLPKPYEEVYAVQTRLVGNERDRWREVSPVGYHEYWKYEWNNHPNRQLFWVVRDIKALRDELKESPDTFESEYRAVRLRRRYRVGLGFSPDEEIVWEMKVKP